MKISYIPLIVLCMLSLSTFAQSKKELRAEVESLKAQVEKLKRPVVDLNDEDHKFAYALGMMQYDQIQKTLGKINANAYYEGMKDAQKDSTKVSMEEANKFVEKIARQKREEKVKKIKAEEKAFFNKNAKKEGVKTTASGLQYIVIKEGTGKKVNNNQKVEVLYEGKFLDGSVFDSTKGGKTATFSPRGVIKGFSEGLMMMKEGAKYKLFIPYRLGYGERGTGSVIPPFSTLIFDVEVVKVK